MTRPTLVEFLTARLDEDEAVARAVPAYSQRFGFSETFISHDGEYTQADSAFVDHHDPARVLADVKAKRAIVAEHVNGEAWCDFCRGGLESDWCTCRTLRHLASVYADHPDYDATWTS
jgi:hypothetical protein